MTYSLITHTFSAGASGGSTTPTIDTTGADLLVVGVVYSATHAPTLTDSKSNTWIAIGVAQENAGNGCQLYYCRGGTVGSGHTFTVTGTSSFSSAFVEAFSGSSTSPLDQNTGNKGPGFSISTGSITPTQNDELISVIFVNYSDAVSQSLDSGMTVTDKQDVSGPAWGSTMGYKIQTTAASINVTGTSGNSTNSAICIASFKSLSDVNINLTSVSAAGAAAAVTVEGDVSKSLSGVNSAGSAAAISLLINSNITLVAVSGAASSNALLLNPGPTLVAVSAQGQASTFAQNNDVILSSATAAGTVINVFPKARIVSLSVIGLMSDKLAVDAIASDRPIATNGTMTSDPVVSIGSLLAA